MKLSQEAFDKLKAILSDELGPDGMEGFTDDLIEDLGVRLLGIMAACLKATLRDTFDESL